jgi:anti-sigma factor RsiW
MMTHLTEDDLVLHYYGETDAGTEAGAAAHLAECRECHRSYTRLQRVLAAVEAAPGPEIADGFERTVWARLQPELEPHRGWLSWPALSLPKGLVFSPARLAWGAAVVVLVAGAYFAGRQSHVEPPAPAAAAAQSASQIRERILLVDLGDHLDRSQMVLVELVSAEGAGTLDISAERDRAVQLVAANRLYRQTAAATGDRAVAALLDELERVLVDVAAGPESPSQADMNEVRQRIDADGLLFKVRVVASQVRERQKNESRVRAGQSS